MFMFICDCFDLIVGFILLHFVIYTKKPTW
jgi:hypothetical protein